MRTSLQVTALPVIEPVSIEQVRAHLRIFSDADTLLVQMYATSARVMAEAYLSRALITTGYLWTVSPTDHRREGGEWGGWRGWEGWGWHRRQPQIELPRAPIQAISSIVLNDIEGNATTLNPDVYVADLALQPGRVRIDYQSCLFPKCRPIENLQFAFTAGYGDAAASVPAPIINAILVTTAFLYEHRGDAGGELPQAAEWLLDPYRIAFFGG